MIGPLFGTLFNRVLDLFGSAAIFNELAVLFSPRRIGRITVDALMTHQLSIGGISQLLVVRIGEELPDRLGVGFHCLPFSLGLTFARALKSVIGSGLKILSIRFGIVKAQATEIVRSAVGHGALHRFEISESGGNLIRSTSAESRPRRLQGSWP